MIDILKKYKKVFIVVVILFFILNSDFIMFNLLDKIDRFTQKRFHLLQKSIECVKVLDSLNPFVGKFALDKYNLPTFDIEMKQKAIHRMSETLYDFNHKTDLFKNVPAKNDYTINFFTREPYASSRFKKWVKGKIYFRNKVYKVKLDFHGTALPHFNNDKKSIAVKLSKKKLLNHMRRFSFVILEEASIPTIFAYKLQEWLDGFKVNSYLIRVKINGIDQGVFLLEEKLQKSLLEKNGLSGVDIMKPIDEWDHQYSYTHEIPFNWNLANQKLKAISKKNVGQLLVFEKLYKCKNYECMKNYIDEKKVLNEEALRVLFGVVHSLEGDNEKLLYNISNAKIWIYFRIEDEIKSIAYFFDKYLYTSTHKYKNSFIYNLGLSEEFRAKRDKILWNFVQQKDKIIKMYDDIYNKNIGPILADSNHYTSGRSIDYTIKQKRANLISNLNTLKKYLSYNKVYSYVEFITPTKLKLVISADSNSPLKIHNIKFDYNGDDKVLITYNNKIIKTTFENLNSYFKDKFFMLGFDKNYNPIEHRHTFIIEISKNTKIKNFDIEFINDVTKKLVPKYYNYKKFIKYTPFIKSQGDLVLNGNYEINKTIVVDNLIIKKGSVIKLAPKVSILANKNITILGTKQNPVIIKNLIPNKPFGVFAGRDGEKVDINYLQLSGGKDAILNGSYFSGGLSLYDYKEVIVKNSFIHHNSADDGMNIKNSSILLENNVFNANKADQVDLDFCKGIVKNNKFIKREIYPYDIKIPIDDNGDGLDLSGSKVIVKQNIFNGFLDKGISVGENTKLLVISNKFLNNRSAITAKDSSKVYISNNFYQNNKINIEMYQKKQIFGYPSVYNIDEKHIPTKIVIKHHQGSFYETRKTITKLDFESLEKIKWEKK